MRIFLHSLLFVFLLGGLGGCSTKSPSAHHRPAQWAQPVITNPVVDNLYRVDNHLYRSGQPDAKGFEVLYNSLHVKNVLNLRQWHDDAHLLQNLPIHYYRVPINSSKMSYEELVKAVAWLSKTKGKTLVHCLHGSDRTGTVVAGYRIAIEGWSKEKAVDEFRFGGYGYHSFWFPNLPELLMNIDEEQFREDVRNFSDF